MNIGPSVISRNESDAGYFVVLRKLSAVGIFGGAGHPAVVPAGPAFEGVPGVGCAAEAGAEGALLHGRGSPYELNARSMMKSNVNPTPSLRQIARRRSDGISITPRNAYPAIFTPIHGKMTYRKTSGGPELPSFTAPPKYRILRSQFGPLLLNACSNGP